MDTWLAFFIQTDPLPVSDKTRRAVTHGRIILPPMATDGSGSDLDDTKAEVISPGGGQNASQVRATVEGRRRPIVVPGPRLR